MGINKDVIHISKVFDWISRGLQDGCVEAVFQVKRIQDVWPKRICNENGHLERISNWSAKVCVWVGIWILIVYYTLIYIYYIYRDMCTDHCINICYATFDFIKPGKQGKWDPPDCLDIPSWDAFSWRQYNLQPIPAQCSESESMCSFWTSWQTDTHAACQASLFLLPFGGHPRALDVCSFCKDEAWKPPCFSRSV